MRKFLSDMIADGRTEFWNDSAEPAEVLPALAMGASGVTTNPILVTKTVLAHPDHWAAEVRRLKTGLSLAQLPHAITAQVVTEIADLLQSIYGGSGGRRGLVCAQVNPVQHDNTVAMVAEAQAFHALRPNTLVKIPATAAGVEAIEELAAQGISTVGTTSFTVPQAIAVAEAYHRGLARWRKEPLLNTNRHNGHTEAPQSFAVLMAGRLDDHLRDVVRANGLDVPEEAVARAGLAVVKRAYAIFRERGYESCLLVGGMRGTYHVTELAGGGLILTIAPAMQAAVLPEGVAYRRTISEPIAPATLERLLVTLNDFRRAYAEDGLSASEFAAFGALVKTQGQFMESYQRLQAFVEAVMVQG